MADDPGTGLRAENEELRARLEEAEATLTAIRTGAVDALVVAGADGHRVYTLEGADQFYRVLIEAMQPGQGAASLSADGTVLYCNKSFAALLGIPQAKVGGRPFAEFIAPPDRTAWRDTLLTAQTSQSQGELRLQPAVGPAVPVHLALNALPLSGAVALGMVVTDLTERRRQEATERLLVREEAARAIAEEVARRAQEADRKKDEFLAVLAHELRNPLAPIRNAAQVMKIKGLPDQTTRNARDVIERQVDHLSRLVDDLLDVSRITRGKITLQTARLALEAVLTSAVEASRPVIETAGHTLSVELPPDPLYLEGDLTRLSQVFGNLLVNAAKYTDRGGRIRLTARREGSDVVVSVADTGIGIPADHLPKLFEMFSQVDPALERTQGGLGIGLSLVKGLVGMHGGSVAARSEGLGRGSEFVVRLPLAIEPPPTRRPDPEADAGAPAAGSRRRVLVADDNIDAAESLAEMLTVMGHEVRTAHDGQAAVEAAAAFRPEVILLDIGMPRLNGYEAARRLRQLAWGGEVLLVALTGWGQEEDKRRAEEAGFDRHFTKPVAVAALTKLLAGPRPAGNAHPDRALAPVS